MSSQPQRHNFSKQLFVVNTWRLLLVAVIVAVLIFQTYFVLQTPVPTYDSFYGMRQVENIKETGVPIINDPLSYQGRTSVSHIIYYYLIAGLSYLAPGLVLFRFAGIFLTACLLILTFIIGKQLFAKDWVALFITVIAGFTPTFFVSQLNRLLPETLFLVLYVLALYFFFNASMTRSRTWFLVIIILGSLITPISLVMIVGFLLYLLLLKVEDLRIRRHEVELLLFAGLFSIWYHLVIYKRLISIHGLQVISSSIPNEILLSAFQDLNVPLIISFVGVPLIGLGLSGIYYLFFTRRNRRLLLLTAMVISFGLFTWAGFLPLTTGIVFATVTLVLISGHTLTHLNDFYDKTILPKTKIIVYTFFLVLLFLSFSTLLIYPGTITDQAPSTQELDTLHWMSNNIPVQSTVLADVSDGHLLSYYAGVTNFYDTNFVFSPSPKQRFADAKTIFLSQSAVSVNRLIDKYGISYLYISPSVSERWTDAGDIATTSPCFSLVYNTSTTEVYKVTC